LIFGALSRRRGNLKASLRRPIQVRELASVIIPVLDLVFISMCFLAIVTASTSSARSVLLAGAAAVPFLAFAMLRTYVIAARLQQGGVIATLQTFVIAVVYDTARALALVVHPSHVVRRRG
jgi:hypothetical protein